MTTWIDLEGIVDEIDREWQSVAALTMKNKEAKKRAGKPKQIFCREQITSRLPPSGNHQKEETWEMREIGLCMVMARY